MHRNGVHSLIFSKFEGYILCFVLYRDNNEIMLATPLRLSTSFKSFRYCKGGVKTFFVETIELINTNLKGYQPTSNDHFWACYRLFCHFWQYFGFVREGSRKCEKYFSEKGTARQHQSTKYHRMVFHRDINLFDIFGHVLT